MKIYRIYIDVAYRKVAEELVKKLDASSEEKWHLMEIDTESKKQNKLE